MTYRKKGSECTCPACGTPLASEDEKCPRCNKIGESADATCAELDAEDAAAIITIQYCSWQSVSCKSYTSTIIYTPTPFRASSAALPAMA